MRIVWQGMLFPMDAAVLHAYPLEGEVRCMQHTLSPQVTEWYILGAEPAYAK